MSRPAKIARSAREVCQLRFHEALAYDGLIALVKLAGVWRYPARASGDLEEMRFLDKVYWVYKSGHPIRRAVRGSGLEAFFESQEAPAWRAHDGFRELGELSVSAVGDLMNHEYLARSAESLYPHVAEAIFGADVAMGNLECVVLESPAGPMQIDMEAGPSLQFEPATFDVVSGHGGRRYTFLAAACNHSLDFGEAGTSSTIRALRGSGIAFHGINEAEEDAERATLIERRGFRLGVVSYCFGLNAHRPPELRPRIVNRMRLNDRPERLDTTLLKTQLRHCRDAGVDFVIAQLHWGMEHEMYPRPEQVEVAHLLVEMGVDAIIGHHPHVLQPVEYYRTRRDPARIAPIYYSLGNLTNPFSASYLCRSGIARIDLVKGVDASGSPRTYIWRADMLPVDQVIDGSHGRIALRLAAGGRRAEETKEEQGFRLI